MIGEPVRRQFCIFTVFLALLLSLEVGVDAGVIVDMKGRRVSVPAKIEKVYCASLPETNIIYALDPLLLVGWNVPPSYEDKRFLNKKALHLPVVGGWFGQGHTANLEALLKADPDIVFLSQWKTGDVSARSEQVLKKLGKPMVYINVFDLDDYPATFLFLGKLLGREKRAARLAAYAEETIGGVKKTIGVIPDRKKVRVYYAEGPDGLSTECTRSWHTELINLAGGRNVHTCTLKNSNDHNMEKVTMEQVLVYNPEVILVREPVFFSRIFADPRWKNVRAVQSGRVYLTPRALFSWFDRPPSFMRLLGLKWLTHLLYPDRYRIDIVGETKHFYRLFLDVDLSDGQIKRIMNF
jgi:iron complex transport system substrate-binding protein